jgi:small conductance mechanosensitive channel
MILFDILKAPTETPTETTTTATEPLTWQTFWERVGAFFLTPDSTGVNYLSRIILAIIWIVISWILIKLLAWVIKKAMGISKKGPEIDSSAKYFIVTCIKSLLWIATAFIVIGILKIDTTGVAGVTSAIAVALGLALQDLIGSLFSGVLLLQQKNIKTGEYIKVTNAFGSCEGSLLNVHLFFTHLQTPQGQIITIPNKNMTSASITNYTRLGKRRVDYDVGLSYDCDVDLAKEAFQDIIDTDIRVLDSEARTVYVASLDSYAVTFRIRCWTKVDDYWPFYNDLSERVLITCRKNKLYIPSSTDIHVDKN